MKDYEYRKTIAVWTDNKADQATLSVIINGKGYVPFICEKEDDLLPIPYFLLFAKYSSEAFNFVYSNYEYRKKVTDGDLKCVVLYHLTDPESHKDISRGYHFPTDVIKIDMDSLSGNEINKIIESQAQKAQRIGKRSEALNIKLNRIFYIYSQLVDNGQISVDVILERAKITRRTLSRDIKTIRDVCIDKSIEHDPDFNSYTMKDLKDKNQHGDH
jgi:hypothetical protein